MGMSAPKRAGPGNTRQSRTLKLITMVDPNNRQGTTAGEDSWTGTGIDRLDS